MKSSVEDRDLRESAAKNSARGKDSFDVQRIVEGRKFDAFFDTAEHIIIDNHRLRKAFAAVHNPMTNCMNVCNALNLRDAGFRACPAHNQLYSGACVTQSGRSQLGVLITRSERHN